MNIRHRAATIAAVALTSILPATAGAAPAPAAQASGSAPKVTSAGALKRAVYAYSKAFLGDDPVKAYNLLTPRCRDDVSLSYFTGLVTVAGDVYGPQPIRTYRATVNGNRARATYTYRLNELNQVREPWVRVHARWKNNDC